MLSATAVVAKLAALPEPSDPDLQTVWRLARTLHPTPPDPSPTAVDWTSEPRSGMRQLFQGRSV